MLKIFNNNSLPGEENWHVDMGADDDDREWGICTEIYSQRFPTHKTLNMLCGK